LYITPNQTLDHAVDHVIKDAVIVLIHLIDVGVDVDAHDGRRQAERGAED
jgi:hypothetical protein